MKPAFCLVLVCALFGPGRILAEANSGGDQIPAGSPEEVEAFLAAAPKEFSADNQRRLKNATTWLEEYFAAHKSEIPPHRRMLLSVAGDTVGSVIFEGYMRHRVHTQNRIDETWALRESVRAEAAKASSEPARKKLEQEAAALTTTLATFVADREQTSAELDAILERTSHPGSEPMTSPMDEVAAPP